MLQSETVKKYDTYKDSGIEWIGEIPQHWVVQKLKQLVSTPLQYGANESGNVFDENLPRYIRITDIKIEDNSLKEEGKLSLSIDKAKDYILHDGDILFARSGATVGKTFLYKSEYGLSAFAGYLIRATIKKTLNPKYIYYFTLSNSYEEWKNRIFIQATIQNIGANKYNNLEISLPLLDEQNDIVKYLDKKCGEIDRVVETEKSVIEKLKEYKQSIITEAVTKGLDKSAPLKDSGIEWIGKIPQHWEVCKIKNYINLQTGSTPSSNEPELLNGDYNWFTPIDFTDNFLLSNSSRKINILAKENNIVKNFPTNTVFIIGIGATTGKIGFSTIEGSCNQQITAMIVNPNNVFSKYLLYWMISNTKILRETACYTTLPIINNTTLGQYIFIKPSIEEQQQIAEYLDKKCSEIDKAIADKEQVIEKFTEYKKSLIYECVTGKRKVVR